MTDQQRTARIEFVKKFLVANGFKKAVLSYDYSKAINKNQFSVHIEHNRIFLHSSLTFGVVRSRTVEIMEHHEPLKPLREFVKLSNQK